MKSVLLTVTGASGVGKDTVTNYILAKTDFIRLGTYTTRAMRPGEVQGDHHFYLSLEEFLALDAKEHFEDHITIGETHYAIPTDKVREELAKGTNVVLVIQVDGVRIIKKHYPNCVSVYLQRPSEAEHLDRFKVRGESEEGVKVRLKEDGPLEDTSEFDLVIVNETGQAEKTADKILEFIKNKVETK